MISDEVKKGGPDLEETTEDLSASLRNNGLRTFRLKTGTPPRVLTNTIDFSKTKDALNVAFEDMEVWWSRVYRNFFEIFNERSERDHRAEMCENCKIDGRRTTFPKGYVYEVAYSALDYSGKISMHKYYVQY